MALYLIKVYLWVSMSENDKKCPAATSKTGKTTIRKKTAAIAGGCLHT
jgi:hypothetical protein